MSCTDSQMYLMNALSPGSGPMAAFGGHYCPKGDNSFYVRCGFSPDGEHVVCGSRDKKMYIWEVGGQPGCRGCTAGGTEVW